MDNQEIARIAETYYVTVLFPILGKEAENTLGILTTGLITTLLTCALPPQEEGDRYAQEVVYPLIGQSNMAETLTKGLIKILEENVSRQN